MGSVQIKGGQIVDSAIIASKLASDSVTSVKIAIGAVKASALSSGAVTSSAIASGALDSASFFASGVIATAALAEDCVTADKVGDGEIGTAALASACITEAKLGSASVTSSKIGTGAILTDAVGNLQISSAKIAADAVDASKLDLTDTYDFTGGTLQVGTPSNGNDVPNKSYVDSVAAGLSVKENVRVASDSNVDLTSAPASIDGINLSNGDRVLLFGQTDQEDNGVYAFAGSNNAMSRTSDMDAGGDFPGAFLFALEGNTYDNQGFVCINDTAPNLGS